MTTLTHLSALAAGSLIAAVWESLVLAAIVALCLRLLPGITAAARSLVWSAAMLVVVALPFVHLPGTAVAPATHQLHLDERVSLALACLWAAFSLLRAAQLLQSAIYLRKLARSAEPLAVAPEIAALLAHTRPVALCVSAQVDRPSVAGFLSPRILLPAALLPKLTAAELQHIVLHEMEHLRRRDDWTNLLQKLSLVLFPLNPVLLWIERRLCLERELACDDQVMRATNARKAYAACLASLAEHSLVRRGVSLALGAWERQSELVRRVHRILRRSPNEMGRRQVAVTVSLMLCGLLAGADVLAHTPQLVSFGPAVTEAQLAPAPTQLIGGHISLAKAILTAPQVAPGKLRFARGTASAVSQVPQNQRGFTRRGTLLRVDQTIPGTPRKQLILQRAEPVAEGSAVETAYDSTTQDSRPMVVMVTWTTTAYGAPQASQFAYAAVPTRNGWLFVQL